MFTADGLFFIQALKTLAICLGERGFVNPPIGDVLSFNAFQSVIAAHVIFCVERDAAVVAKIKLGEIAVHVRFTRTEVWNGMREAFRSAPNHKAIRDKLRGRVI